MQHPLTNPSLAPYGFVTPIYERRLKCRSDFGINYERIIAKLWAKIHRRKAQRPLPIETIIHEILPAMGSRYRLLDGDFRLNDQPYLSRDILLLSTFVQWFGTSVGFNFLTFNDVSDEPGYHPEREYVLKLARCENRRGLDLITFLTHVCTPFCKSELMTGLDPCVYDKSSVTERDRAVAEGLMRWLGTKAGRAFTDKYLWLRKNAEDIKRQRDDIALKARGEKA